MFQPVNTNKISDLTYQVLMSLPQPALILDRNYHIIFRNEAWQRSFETDASNIPQYIWEALPKLRNRITDMLDEVFGLMERVTIQEQQIDNTCSLWNITMMPLVDDDYNTFIGIVADEVAKQQTQAEQHHKHEFIQMAAHELRTPLTTIIGFSQLLSERYRERTKGWFFKSTLQIMEEYQRDHNFLSVLMDESKRLDEISHELLSISKIEQGKFEVELQESCLIQVVKEALEEFHIPDSFHSLKENFQITEARSMLDVSQIKRVIHNLLSNAIKYSPDSPHIYIDIAQQGAFLYLYVRDEGIGIPDTQKTRVFERFFRVHTNEHEPIQGFGVGLYICKEILQLHGGRIGFKSTYGEGSTFYIKLPKL